LWATSPSCALTEAIVKLLRRQFLQLATSAAALAVVPRIARAQTYPSRPVRIIVGFPAGGVSDITARLFGQWLSERLGQSFVIENRPGASGTIAMDSVVRAPPDGYTLLLTASADAYLASLYPDLRFDYFRDISQVAGIALTPNVMEVNPVFPAKTVAEFINYAKANPGKINYASGGVGTGPHLCGELFKMMTGIDMLHVPYRGTAPAISDLLGGRVQVMFDFLPSSIEYVRAGRLRALAVTTAARNEFLPDVPTVADFVPGFEASLWLGVGAPRNTPAAVIDKLNKEINSALADAKMKTRLADLAATVLPGSRADFGKLIAEETEKWGKVIRAANIKAQ
jgi:tripartite-type tricarboxylate transporter receptor subunit TctC